MAHITLRKLKLSDVDNIMQWENDRSLWHLSGAESEYSREQIIDFVECHLDPCLKVHSDQLRLIIELENKYAIGAIDLYDYDPMAKVGYIGILVYSDNYRQCGFGSDAIKLMEEYASKEWGVEEFNARVQSNNVASLQLFKKCGYEVLDLPDIQSNSSSCIITLRHKYIL